MFVQFFYKLKLQISSLLFPLERGEKGRFPIDYNSGCCVQLGDMLLSIVLSVFSLGGSDLSVDTAALADK